MQGGNILVEAGMAWSRLGWPKRGGLTKVAQIELGAALLVRDV